MCARFLLGLRRVLRCRYLVLFLYAMLLSQTVIAESPQSNPSLMQLLTQADQSLNQLETRLRERKTQIERLQKELTTSENLIAQARELRDKSQAELTETSTRLVGLESRLEKLSQDFEKYKAETNSQIRHFEFKIAVYRGVSVTLGIGCVAGAAYVVGDRMGWW